MQTKDVEMTEALGVFQKLIVHKLKNTEMGEITLWQNLPLAAEAHGGLTLNPNKLGSALKKGRCQNPKDAT